ncbi:Serine/threonine protein kinase [Forsythia ovata]|uniref:Serine/threonine protein kinase n=1 Tax=Forsythia ovata TaxID=205694 RepID=A0ABD1T8I7_9LAMI
METPSRRSTSSMGVSPGGENKTDSNASGRRRTTFSTPTEDAKTKEITKMKACKTDSTKKSKKNRKRKSYIPQLGGSIPSEIGGNCGKLEHLELAGNILVEGIPKSIGKCRGLKTLLLYSNMLEEVIPIELGQLRQLEVVDISRNNIGGSILAASSGDFFCSRQARASISCSS